jgi:hypothetical protein
MKRVVLLTSVILVSAVSFAQKWTPEIICTNDTLTVEPNVSMKYYPDKMDSSKQERYKIVPCQTRAKIGLRVGFAVSNYYYGNKTTSWIGQHGGPNLNINLVVDKLNFGIKFKPWTINPRKELEFNGQILPTHAKLNNIRLDYYIGYSFDFENLFSLEPFAGYNYTSFRVINEDELNQDFDMNKTGGVILGTTLNKYFKLKDYGYLSVFGTIGYGFVNYDKVHSDLDNGYMEWSLGVAWKSFAVKRINKRVE